MVEDAARTFFMPSGSVSQKRSRLRKSSVPIAVISKSTDNLISVSMLLDMDIRVYTTRSRAGHSKASVTTDIYGQAVARL